MKFINVLTSSDLQKFYACAGVLYKDNHCYRDTEHDVVKMLVERKSVFFQHAEIQSVLITGDGEEILGRFSMIVDRQNPNVVQISFFEALPGIPDLAASIADECRKRFPQCNQLVVGLNAHLNYGAGFLCSRFDEPPVFGLPYSMDYYPDYFKAFDCRRMLSYRYPVKPFFKYFNSRKRFREANAVKVRTMSKKRLKEDISIYTYLNNASFQKHLYWSDRTEEEDYELFKPFSPMLDEENLLFAEVGGKPVGFLLWYPDFNQLVRGGAQLGIFEWLRFRCLNPINAFRFTEFGVHAQFRNSMIVDEMIRKLSEIIEKTPYRTLEGGFIFEENKASIAVSLRYAMRTLGRALEPYREYTVFEYKLR